MCRTLQALVQTVICFAQMLVRIIMTLLLMIENLIRMIFQTVYNFISFILQMLSLIPICCVFIITSRLRCLMCCGDGGGCCPAYRGRSCDCLLSLIFLTIVYFIFKATGLLDKIVLYFGYTKLSSTTTTTTTEKPTG